jgi:5'-methylthioadenosine/S-adenosylhomocysteine nucleosidase
MKIETDSLLKFNIEPTSGLDGGFKVKGKNTVFVMETGVGPISAGVRCQKYIDLFNIDLVVLVGLAGGIDSSLSVGDHVIATKVFQYDAICMFEDREELMSPGNLHLSVPAEKREKIWLESDSETSNSLKTYLIAHGEKVHSGAVASGSSFVGKKEEKYKIKRSFPDAVIVEMEAIGIAMSAKSNNKPFIVIKTVADSLDGNDIESYVDYVKSEKSKCANIVSYFL